MPGRGPTAENPWFFEGMKGVGRGSTTGGGRQPDGETRGPGARGGRRVGGAGVGGGEGGGGGGGVGLVVMLVGGRGGGAKPPAPPDAYQEGLVFLQQGRPGDA